jgi:hypothetical protein
MLTKGHLADGMAHSRPVAAATFDEPNLVSSAGLVPVMRLAAEAGLDALADELLTVPSDKGANGGGKVAALMAGMIAGADCIDDMALLRHGAMGKLFDRPYAPSTLGSFLRFSFGHVRQLDAVASRLFTWPSGSRSAKRTCTVRVRLGAGIRLRSGRRRRPPSA